MRLRNREKEIINLLKKGLTHKQVAQELNICKKTVDSLLYDAYKRNGVHSLIELLVGLGEFNENSRD